MLIKLTNFNAEHYAANLTSKGDFLKWESSGATHFMIARMPFGVTLDLSEEHIDKLNQLEQSEKAKLFSGNGVTLNDVHFTFLPRSGINTYAVTVKPAAYAVFACELQGESFTIYNPNEACFHRCSVPATVELCIKKAPLLKEGLLERFKGAFKTPHEPVRYYFVELKFAQTHGQSCNNFLYYSYGDCSCKFPVTNLMLNKTLLIPELNGSPPEFASHDLDAYKIMNNS